MTRFLTVLLIALLPCGAVAQTYPDYTSTYLNDFADLLPEVTERSIVASLTSNRERTGVETVVVTLPGTALYPDTMVMEDFATGLFNHWGVGDATRNDGVMILVLPELRAMRIELGAGYEPAYDDVAQRIINDTMLPAFKEGHYPRGIEQGLLNVLTQIVTPKATGAEPPAPSGSKTFGRLLLWGMAGFVVLALAKQGIGDKLMRLRRCPQCGRRGLQARRKIGRRATKSSQGYGWRTITCSRCSYHDRTRYSIARIGSSRGSSSSFGGGSSSGGGASGRW